MKRFEFAKGILEVQVAVDPLDGLHIRAVGEVDELVLDVVRPTRDVPEDVPHQDGVEIIHLGVTGVVVSVSKLRNLQAVWTN